ncbi:unnamed protein product, partial [Brachionus calyciflorus]
MLEKLRRYRRYLAKFDSSKRNNFPKRINRSNYSKSHNIPNDLLNVNNDNSGEFSIPLESAFNNFCRYLLTKNLKDLTNQNIARYKRWHQAEFVTLESVFLNNHKDIKIENFNFCLIEIFKRLKPEFIVNSIYEFLNKIVNEKPNIGGKGLFSNEMIKILSNIRNEAEKNYIINPTISLSNTNKSNIPCSSRGCSNQQIIPD